MTSCCKVMSDRGLVTLYRRETGKHRHELALRTLHISGSYSVVPWPTAPGHLFEMYIKSFLRPIKSKTLAMGPNHLYVNKSFLGIRMHTQVWEPLFYIICYDWSQEKWRNFQYGQKIFLGFGLLILIYYFSSYSDRMLRFDERIGVIAYQIFWMTGMLQFWLVPLIK